jgi:hypothetical protein
MKLEVEYTVKFKATVEVDDNATEQELMDACGDVDIPEGGAHNSEYVTASFDLNSVTDVTGKNPVRIL